MNQSQWLLLAGSVIGLICLCIDSYTYGGWKFLFGIATVGCLITSCGSSDWNAEQSRQAAIEQRARETPHVIREFDGCKVYAFEAAGSTKYVTRCPSSQATTESSHRVSCGKSCSRSVSESITTEAK